MLFHNFVIFDLHCILIKEPYCISETVLPISKAISTDLLKKMSSSVLNQAVHLQLYESVSKYQQAPILLHILTNHDFSCKIINFSPFSFMMSKLHASPSSSIMVKMCIFNVKNKWDNESPSFPPDFCTDQEEAVCGIELWFHFLCWSPLSFLSLLI